MATETRTPSSPPQDSADQRQHQSRGDDDHGEAEELLSDANGPAHHPLAPADELFDIQTTVDPGYIISLIRRLLPSVERHHYTQGSDHGDDPSGKSENDLAEDDVATLSRNSAESSVCDGAISVDIGNIDHLRSPKSQATGVESRLAREEVWEESGCILWDLAANKSHAEFMVENLVLEVLLANLLTSNSVRITEISMGIIGNLACHEGLMKKMISTNGLVEAILDQLFLDDTPCLSETCRLLGLGLGIPERITWATALQSEHLLSRILWIAENTLNPQLIEKSSGLLLAIVENEPEVVAMFLPTLKNLGLMHILVNLLSFELSKLSERLPERYPALESILRVIEAVSTSNEYSQEISFNLELFQMAVELVKLPDKLEVASSCITAAVLVANLLTDSTHLALELSKDPMILQCLFDLFPLTSDDFEARNAIWSIVSRILVQVKEDDMSSSYLATYVLALVSNSDLIEDDLLDYPLETSSQEEDSSSHGTGKLNFREIALKQILSLLDQWIMVKDRDSISSGGNHVADGDVQKLLDCCLRHTS
ncbi:hypothetical protein Droror1_Dr00004069 [Drosera rotundifolia]